MTEDEAKYKTCPQTFGWEHTEERDILHSEACVASDCMMWVPQLKLVTDRDGDRFDVIGGRCGLVR